MTRGIIQWVLADGSRLVRLPLGVLFILGGVLSILPIFGLWMLPLGLMLLAVDVAASPTVSAAIIRARRRIAVWRHR